MSIVFSVRYPKAPIEVTAMRFIPNWLLKQPQKSAYSPHPNTLAIPHSPAIAPTPLLSLVTAPTDPDFNSTRHAYSHRVPNRPNWRTWLRPLQCLRPSAIGQHATSPIAKFVNGSDCWWYTWDPDTHQHHYADSEAELRLWIERRHERLTH